MIMMMMSSFVRMHEDLKVMAECNEHISTYSTFKVSWTLSMSPSALTTKSPTFHERSLPTTRFVAQTLMTSAYSIQCIAGALTAELHNIYQEGDFLLYDLRGPDKSFLPSKLTTGPYTVLP